MSNAEPQPGAAPAHQAVTGRILANMADGVLVIDLSGRILEFNAAAAAMLGLDREATLAGTFAETFLAQDNDAFNQAILDAVYDAQVTHDRVVPYRQGERQLTLDLTTSFLTSAEGRRLGVIAVFTDITALLAAREVEERLTAELRLKHEELLDAYRQTEERNQQLDQALKKVQVIRVTATAFTILLFLGVGLYAWQASTPGPLAPPPGDQAPSGTAPGATTLTLSPRHHSQGLALSGKVLPLRLVNLGAPFGGKLGQLQVQYGDRVGAGQVLLTMDDSEAAIKYREAKAAAIKAHSHYLEVAYWEEGSEVARANRSLIRARMSLEKQRETFAETQRLLDKGIIPATEHDQARQQLANQELDFTNAEEELAAVVKKGDAENLEVARMELENAETKARLAEEELARAQVKAPVTGLAMKPPSGGKEGQDSGKGLEEGATYQKDQVLLAIGDLTGLAIDVKLDEIDVTRVQPGQGARVTLDAFPGIQLTGEVLAIAPHADEQSQGAPAFTARVAVETIPDDLRERILVGMSANVEILIHDNPAALLVPLTAVRAEGGKRYVYRRPAPGAAVEAVAVQTGFTTQNEVEILTGLAAGDLIETVAPPRAPAGG